MTCRTTQSASAVTRARISSPWTATRRDRRCAVRTLTALSFRCGRLVVDPVLVSERDATMRASKKPQTIPRDPSGKWRKRVNELADTLGWYHTELWNLYDETCCIVEYEHRKRLSRPQSEDSAYRILVAMVDKQGRAEAN